MQLHETDSVVQSLIRAVQSGDTAELAQLLQGNPGLASATLVHPKGHTRSTLHIAADWPGHFPNVAESIRLLIVAGADPNVQVSGVDYHAERPLHGAASSDDVAALDALLEGGADIEGDGAVFTGGAAMSDAVIFANWRCARRLLERGAKTTLTQSAALGLMDRVRPHFAGEPPPAREVTAALWHACRGGQQAAAEYLIAQGADRNWLGWDHMTPLDCARKSGNEALVAWLVEQGAKSPRG